MSLALLTRGMTGGGGGGSAETVYVPVGGGAFRVRLKAQPRLRCRIGRS